MEQNYNGSISFDIEHYDSSEDMFEDIKKIVQILSFNDYMIRFRYEDCGIYTLEYGDYPFTLEWVNLEEEFTINEDL